MSTITEPSGLIPCSSLYVPSFKTPYEKAKSYVIASLKSYSATNKEIEDLDKRLASAKFPHLIFSSTFVNLEVLK